MTTSKVSVIVPFYNEAGNVRSTIAELLKVLSSCNRDYEVIAVDDGSTDHTLRFLEQIASTQDRLRVICFKGNAGQTAAFDAGFRLASGDYVITMDGDGQNDPHDIPRLVDKLDEGFDFVSGWRKNRKDKLILRRAPSKVANWLIRLITGTKLNDLGCSLKAYRSYITKQMSLFGEMHRFIGVIVPNMGARTTELVVNHRPRLAGDSKYNLTRIPKVLLDLTTVVFMQRFRTKPLYLFGSMSMISFILSVAFSTKALWDKYFLAAPVHRNPLFNISIFLGTAALQLFVLGLLAELTIRIYFESSDRKPYFVARFINCKPPLSADQPISQT